VVFYFALLFGALSLFSLSEPQDTHLSPDYQVVKQKAEIGISLKTYFLPNTERISLYGAHDKKFLNSNWYWGESGFGALAGKRSGYLEGGLILGYQSLLFDNLWGVKTDISALIGAGGGGGAPQGGGFLVSPKMGLGLPIGPGDLWLDIGYVHFVNGDISSVATGVSYTLPLWRLAVEASHQKEHP